MVCIYCGAQTSVSNSRPQKRLNQIWRRRQCEKCAAIVTTHESIDYSQSLVVRSKDSKLAPFRRDKLFLSIYQSCRHRQAPVLDASALVATAMAAITLQSEKGVIDAALIRSTTYSVLHRFDKVAAVQYRAFHPESQH